MSINQEGRIKDVYEENLIEEIRKMAELIEEFPNISMVIFLFNVNRIQNSLALSFL